MNETSRSFWVDMQSKLSDFFSLSEIETLSFNLGIDHEALRGSTKPTKANALLMQVARNGRLEELLTVVRRERANVTWPSIPAGLEFPESAGPEADGATIYQIQNLTTGGGPFIDKQVVNGDVVGGSKYVLSGDFKGAVLNIQSRLDNVTQTIQSMPAGTQSQKAQLESLVNELKTVLATVPPTEADDAAVVVRRIERLAEEVSSEEPDPELVDSLSDSLRRAAAKLTATGAVVLPLVASIVEIAAAIIK